MNNFLKYYILFFLILINISVPYSLSENLRDIQRKEFQEREEKKQRQQKECNILTNMFNQSDYRNIVQPYNLSGKTDTFAAFRYYGWQNNGSPRIYINPTNNKLMKITSRSNNYGSSQLCGVNISPNDREGIPFGTLNKKIKLGACKVNKNEKQPYEIVVEVFKEYIFDENYRQDREFLVRYHKVGDCNGNWSGIYTTIIGTSF